ncbi:glycosyltransferase family 32 protein [Athelia psychrophila]|uniref:Glycosyltransferase family 32 protein n=1 Tax=Athelia psychrophila TaxID=1759441 RepID=A0A166FIT1_9AGAM|nr:glycosyltransferase family 32 protein [Fibularhizoctonia sp. CBS 109695]
MSSSSIYMPRGNGHRDKGRISLLSSHSSVHERHDHRHLPWTTLVTLPIPGIPTRQLKIPVPSLARIHQTSIARFGRKRGSAVLAITVFALFFTLFALAKRFGGGEQKWPTASFSPPSTLVFGREELQKIWKWEIESGHHPSGQKVPEEIGFTNVPANPSLPPRKPTIPPRFSQSLGPMTADIVGIGPKRVYLDIQSSLNNVAYPPRPVPGSVADLDVIMEHCDFSQQKYVRDCLEVLRLGGGLDSGNRLRRGKMDEWKYIFLEDEWAKDALSPSALDAGNTHIPGPPDVKGLRMKPGAAWEQPLPLLPPSPPKPVVAGPSPCDDDNPRIFHMFWTGPFTDKPYAALMSFLYTQNTGIHLPRDHETNVCRPKFWFWVNPGPAASVANPSAYRDMFDELKNNSWSAPFLHPRFQDVIYFKLWNITDQLDNTPEMKDEWRSFPALFNSGGHKFEVPKAKSPIAGDLADKNGTASLAATRTSSDGEDIYNRVGSQSAETVDKLSTVMSDIARFLLCHRYGGVYLDADNLLLRDWEELWGWKGAFAYRWSRLPGYNTAILRMHKHSAIGSFLFRTALKNDLDFHPMTITKYFNDAHLQDLLFRVPDALFDPAFLSVENYQRDRPPQPVFDKFEEFFDTPVQDSAAPGALGFDGFFKGAYCYHWHNSYWTPFDRARNWPDLGPRFSSQVAAEIPGNSDKDTRDLGWSTVMKRTFEAYIRGDRPNMYGEWIQW